MQHSDVHDLLRVVGWLCLCGYFSTDQSNANRHLKRCDGGCLQKKYIYVLAYAETEEEARAVVASGQVRTGLVTSANIVPSPSSSGSGSGSASAPAYAPPVHTRESLLRDDVVEFGSEGERQAMAERLRLDTFGRVCDGLAVRVFERCKVGADIPLALGNMAVSGNIVYYKQDGETVAHATRAVMVKDLLVRLLEHIEAILDGVFERTDLGLVAQRMLSALYRQMYDTTIHCAVSALDMARLYRDNPKKFKASKHEYLKEFVKKEAFDLAECLNRLPRYSHRG